MRQTELIMLGTGNAAVTRCYNTCFALRTDRGILLTDAGGGNGILVQLEKAGIAVTDIHDIFVTHAHTDHVLGVIWMIRTVAQQMQQGKYEGELRVWGHDKALQVIDWICRMTLPAKIVARLGVGIHLCEVKDGEGFEACGLKLKAFDIFSTKEKQFGFRAYLPTDSGWSAWGTSHTTSATAVRWREPTGSCVRLSACMPTRPLQALREASQYGHGCGTPGRRAEGEASGTLSHGG